MTSHPTTTAARPPQFPQAVERLLDAIAANPDYKQTGVVTYTPIPSARGRWQAGEHTCGDGTINTAATNKLITLELLGPKVRVLALTAVGLDHVQARHARRSREANAR
ncbi:hypothetical protein FXF51_01735 [Nonomuraea sp. PA05]|uniref:hypothetical protein n=1 Tax=Nonomuraea sp. PA05 TaxID=2604466 RepID=UPI0011D6C9F1|nr:hypothetical protein [Nonomuraea sp. PA05]TYB71183.1 hypothetical protein FXF51_01735 [Nonomuraea sp. PA05]